MFTKTEAKNATLLLASKSEPIAPIPVSPPWDIGVFLRTFLGTGQTQDNFYPFLLQTALTGAWQSTSQIFEKSRKWERDQDAIRGFNQVCIGQG